MLSLTKKMSIATTKRFVSIEISVTKWRDHVFPFLPSVALRLLMELLLQLAGEGKPVELR